MNDSDPKPLRKAGHSPSWSGHASHWNFVGGMAMSCIVCGDLVDIQDAKTIQAAGRVECVHPGCISDYEEPEV